MIAFTSNLHSQGDVYTIPTQGGVPRRLTFMSSTSRTVGFAPDGRVVVASLHEAPLRGCWQLYLLDPHRLTEPEKLPVGRGLHLGFDPQDPTRVVLGRNSTDAARWKRYRGGTAGEMWVGALGSGDFERVRLEKAGNHVQPCFVDGRLFFLSDIDGWGNVWSCLPDGSDLTQHTHHRDFYARFMRAHGRELIYQKGAQLWCLDLDSGQPRPLAFEALPSGRQLQPRFVDPGEHLQDTALLPTGKGILATVRGKGVAMGAWSGPVRRMGPRSGVRLRLPAWLAHDELWALFVSDEGGQEAPVIYNPIDGSLIARLEIPDPRRIRAWNVHPKEHAFALVDIANRVRLVTLDKDLKATTKTLFEDPKALTVSAPVWSPDGRWLAFVCGYDWTSEGGKLRLVDTQTGEGVWLADDGMPFRSPAFDARGPFLHVLSERDFNPMLDASRFGAAVVHSTGLYTFVLTADGLSPYDPRWLEEQEEDEEGDDTDKDAKSDESDGDGDGAEEQEGDGESKEAKDSFRIDLEGLDYRLVKSPDVPLGGYHGLVVDGDKILLLDPPMSGMLDEPSDDSDQSRLMFYDLKTGELTTLVDHVDAYEARDGWTLMHVDEGLRLIKSGEEPPKDVARPGKNRHTGWIDLDRIRLEVTPQHEWRQMYHEAWRLQRERFWSETMADIDWEEVRDRYLPVLDRVQTRAEFSDLIWELQGELGTSHAYEFQGDYPELRDLYDVGGLGAELRWDGQSMEVLRILRGDCWQPKSASPLAACGVQIAPGDRICAVDGVPLGEGNSLGRALLERAGVDVELTVQPANPEEDTFRQVVRPLEDELELRYRDWVTRNRQHVLERSEGKLGYLHLPDMSGRGLSEFLRAFRTQARRPGLLIDVRGNGGGFVSSLIIDCLQRRVIGFEVPRYGGSTTYPADAVRGPMVALIDQYTGSDGDIFAHAFKTYGLGPLVGRRTWGGTVGIDINELLADGTVVTQPEFASFFYNNGWELENYGVEPDIEVDLDPASEAAGQDPQLDKAIEVALDMLRKAPVEEPSLPAVPTRRFK